MQIAVLGGAIPRQLAAREPAGRHRVRRFERETRAGGRARTVEARDAVERSPGGLPERASSEARILSAGPGLRGEIRPGSAS